MSCRSKESGVALAYALRRENSDAHGHLADRHTPQLPANSPGGAEPTGLSNDEAAFERAAERAVTELRRPPAVALPGRAIRPGNRLAGNPLQTVTFAIDGPEGIYNTLINVYALHRCSTARIPTWWRRRRTDGDEREVAGRHWEGPNPTFLNGNVSW